MKYLEPTVLFVALICGLYFGREVDSALQHNAEFPTARKSN